MEKDNTKKKREEGFSLVEIMAVIIIMALIALAGGTAVMNRIERAKRDLTITQITKISDNVTMYKLEKGSYPESLDDLVDEFIESKDKLLDGWKNQFYYAVPGDNGAFDIVSGGPDGSLDTIDDNINSWELVKKNDEQ